MTTAELIDQMIENRIPTPKAQPSLWEELGWDEEGYDAVRDCDTGE